MSLPALFLPPVALWLIAWSVALAMAWRNRCSRAAHALSLFDDDTFPDNLERTP